MRMKKIFLVLAALFCVAATASAGNGADKLNSVVQTATSSKWSLGLRATYGVQAVAECFYATDKYVEGRLGLGLGFGNGLGADFTLLHNWNCANWNWTPKAGTWFLDAGVGANVGGNFGWVYAGIAGGVKFGIKFNKVPIRLAIDYTPVIGTHIKYGYKEKITDAGVDGEPEEINHPTTLGFHDKGFYNLALSATWCF